MRALEYLGGDDSRPLYKRESKVYSALLGVLPLLLFVLALAPMVYPAQGHAMTKSAPDRWWWDTLCLVVSAIVAIPLGTTWFVWYSAARADWTDTTTRLEAPRASPSFGS